MKKRIIKFFANWGCIWPIWLYLAVVVLVIFNKNMYFTPMALPVSIIVVVSSLLLAGDKWQGAIVGSLNGIYLIIEYYYKLHINEKVLIDSRPIGLLIIVYYIYMAYRVGKKQG